MLPLINDREPPEVHLHVDIISNLLCMWVKGQRTHHVAEIGPLRLDGGGFTSRLNGPAVTEMLGGDVVLV